MIRYLIIDDEPIAHRIIEKYAGQLPHLQKIGNCYNAFEAMQILQQQKIDVLFLDINMPKMKGFDLLKTLQHTPDVIVTTAYQEFALEGYELNVLDYLLKPFSFERFAKAINKIKIPVSPPVSTLRTETTEIQSLFIKGDKKHYQINLTDILYVEAYGNYTKIHLEDQIILSHLKISELEQRLPSSFIRVHKSFIASKPRIQILEGNMIHISDHKIPVGQTYRKKMNELLK